MKRNERGKTRGGRLWYCASGLIASLLTSACGGPSKDLPNVMIVVMDTARQDHLGLYGYEKPTSPNLELLASESTDYANAYTPGGWTIPAHASLFTGLYSVAHQTTQEDWRMPDNLTTLAEVFKATRYKTIAIIENPMLNTQNNFQQGFEQYKEAWRLEGQEGLKALSVFKKSLSAPRGRKPLFLFVNLVGPHSPYDSSGQFRDRFVSDLSINIEDNMWREYFLGDKDFSEGEIRHLVELYDSELLMADHVVGEMVKELKDGGLWENTVFIVTSDHGENIGDHGLMDHVFSLHESIIRVPLLIHYPKLFPPGVRHEYPVELTDIFPTLLEIAGIDFGRYPSQGISLLGPERPAGSLVISEYYYPRQALEGMKRRGLIETEDREKALAKYKRRIRAVIDGDMKLIWGGDGRHELYDLGRDPDEKVNLVGDPAYADTVERLIRLLEGMVEKYRAAGPKQGSAKAGQVDDVTREKLKSLGYTQ